jgi:DUF1680 family protein
LAVNTSFSQEGDQSLDGIGETGLIARYLLDDSAKDWSRNDFNGQIIGPQQFVSDDTFGKVLALSSANKKYIQLPSQMLVGEAAISITGWVYLPSAQPNKTIVDFGREGQSKFSIVTKGTNDNGQSVERPGINSYASSIALKPEKWHHFAVVIHPATKSINTYVDGVLVEEKNIPNLEVEMLFSQEPSDATRLYIGRSLSLNPAFLDARLHDYRFYRIPLNEQQITNIYRNAIKIEAAAVNERKETNDDLPQFDENTPQLYNQYLMGVPDINVTTNLGHLPRLPRYIPGQYKAGINGGKVRVQWPAPENNLQVLKPGKYTITGTVAGTAFQPKAFVTVLDNDHSHTPDRNLVPFSLRQVQLGKDIHGQNTKFIKNRDLFISTLAQTDPDAFLYMFRNAFGQEQPKGAVPLKGWDSQETKLRGHATGHYLTAIAQAYASTAYSKSLQDNFYGKMEYMVDVLYQLSQLSGQPNLQEGQPSSYIADPTAVKPSAGKADFDSDLSEEGIRTDYWNWGKGYLSAYPPDQFIMLEKGAKYGRDSTKVWAPYYTLHKILTGLLDVYELTGNEKALETAKGMGTWVHARLSQLSNETLIKMWNTYIAGEYGGMNEVMARLYRLTNEKQYFELAQLFDNIKVFYGDAQRSHGLAKNVDSFRGLHANQHIPQIVGALEMYRDSKEPSYYHIADNFWYKATQDYSYSIGGVAGARTPANAECFTIEPATLYEHGLSVGGQNETCATYNMLKLTKNLFLFDQRGDLMDYYERALYNHILASVSDDSPANTYHVPLRAGSIKRFGNAEMDGFTCCNGTALESSTKLQNSIYFRSQDDQQLYVNLFIPSTLDWTERKVRIVQQTAFPKEDRSRLLIKKGKGKFDLKIRIPHWATKGASITINGKLQEVNTSPGSYVSLQRKWKKGDLIEIHLPFQFHLAPLMDQQNIASLFYGPVLLAAQETEARKDWRAVTLSAEDISQSIKGDPKKLEFEIDGVPFKPFYETFGHHSVYLNVTLK